MSNEDLLALLDEHGFTLRDFGAADREFLRGVWEEEEATTSDLRGYALGRKQIHYRYNALEEDGLIEVDRVGLDEHDGRKQNVATLTDLGERFIEAGLLDEVTDSNTNLEEMDRRISQLIEDVNGAIRELNSDYRKVHRRLDELEARVEGES